MKKNYLFIALVFLASCSNNNDDDNLNNNNDGPVLVTKSISDGEAITYKYNGSKLLEEKNMTTGAMVTYTYSGNLIVKIVDFDGSSTQTLNFSYDGSDRLIKVVSSELPANRTETVDYTYLASDHVKIVEKYSSSGYTQTSTKDAYLNADGSMKNYTETYSDSSPQTGTGTLQTIVYDTKNTPWRNIIGFSNMQLYIIEQPSATHNVLNYSHMLNFSGGTGNSWSIFKSNYEYNSSGYPVKSTTTYYEANGTTPNGQEITTYEYNHL